MRTPYALPKSSSVFNPRAIALAKSPDSQVPTESTALRLTTQLSGLTVDDLSPSTQGETKVLRSRPGGGTRSPSNNIAIRRAFVCMVRSCRFILDVFENRHGPSYLAVPTRESFSSAMNELSRSESGETKRESPDWHLEGSPTFQADIEFLLDGRDYMDRWFWEADRVDSPGGGILHSAWRVNNVILADLDGTHDEHLLAVLKRYRGTIHIRLSGHAYSFANSIQFLRLKAIRLSPTRNSQVFVYIDANFSAKVGSFHQKTTCFLLADEVSVLVGSVDLTRRRKDTNQHTRRSSAARRPSHDVGVLVRGPAAHEIASNEFDLWLLASYYRNRFFWPFRTPKVRRPELLRPLLLDRPSARAAWAGTGNATVQVLRTRGRPTKRRSWQYSFETHDEFQDAYLNALARAREFIYIEDQYFIPNFGDAAYGSWPWSDQRSPLSDLKDAMARGVQIVGDAPVNGSKRSGHSIDPRQCD